MSTRILACLVSLACVTVCAQESVTPKQQNAAAIFRESRPRADIEISDKPTAQEMADLYVAASEKEIDPFALIAKIGEKKNTAVEGLKELLFSSAIRGKRGPKDENALPPNRLYVVTALEVIGTAQAYDVLLQAAKTHPDANIRGVALNALGTSYYGKVTEEKWEPDKEILRLLFVSADDTARVEYLHRSIGGIARDGLKKWLGRDFGSVQSPSTKVRVRGKQQMTLKEYRQWWWEEAKTYVRWDKVKLTFVLEKQKTKTKE